jgi:hypothetical protein
MRPLLLAVWRRCIVMVLMVMVMEIIEVASRVGVGRVMLMMDEKETQSKREIWHFIWACCLQCYPIRPTAISMCSKWIFLM